MSIKDETIELMCRTLDVTKEELKENQKLYDSIGVDSTEIVELTVSLKKHFGVQLETNEITKMSTPLEIAALIEKKKRAIQRHI
ncbi:MAG: acyl carrier protein [Candidatus Omnitrophota bacterium]